MSDKKKSLAALNKEQKRAVTAEDRRVLVLAGAGAGKTRTLLEKILYLIQEKGISPDKILAITFTKNAANEMIDRLLIVADQDKSYSTALNDKTISARQLHQLRLQKAKEVKWINRLTIRTFHSLCFTILKHYGAKEYDNKFKLLLDGDDSSHRVEYSKIKAAESQYDVLHKMLIKCCENRDFLLKFKRYIIDFLVDRIHVRHPQVDTIYPNQKYYTSLNGNKVRSKSEQYICDWLYRHNINYIYEPKIDLSGFAFRPDFFIPEANLFIEHVSNLSSGMELKEKVFKDSGRTMVKTFENMTHDTALFNEILTRIVRRRLPADYSQTTMLSYEEEMSGRHPQVKDFLRQVLRVLDLVQVDRIDLQSLRHKIAKEKHSRVRDFYQCAIPIIESYQQYCVEKSYLDFNQLISVCIDLIKKNDDIKRILHEKYQYVLVDEFQDVNSIQVNFLKTVMDPSSQLFCVGDDWQSIYAFRGSDVGYIVNFNKYFKDSKLIVLNKNYRSTDTIVKASNEVISNNTFKIEKNISSATKSKKKIEVYSAIDHKDGVAYCVEKVKWLKNHGLGGDDILFLYRRSKMFDPYRSAFKKHNLKVNAKTIHSAKGLESSIVFIIGMTEGYGGFPDLWMDDRIYHILRPINMDQMMEEERRLFYVALTRAKDSLFLITELGNESSFLKEIPDDFKTYYSTPLELKKVFKTTCPNCTSIMDPSFKFCPECGLAST